jgi:putative phage-type endonuclease
MPLIEGLDQQTPEWLVHRVAMVTASRVADVMNYLKKGGESQARKNYKSEIVCEVLTGLAYEHYVTPAMEWGISTEPLAVAAYEVERDVELEPGGFWVHDAISRFGASPDRLIGSDGIAEIKCPTTATHIDYLSARTVPEEYQWQILAQLACTGRQWCDFVSFDPRLPKKFQMFVCRFPRDDKRIAEMETEVCKFLEEVAALIIKLGAKEQTLQEKLEASLEAVTK